MSITAIIAFLIVFGLLVSFHEFGHFIVAKMSGVLVREFAIGMGPKVFSWYKNNTAYTIRLLPVGGYVRMASEEDHDKLDAGQRLFLEENADGFVTKLDLRADQEGAGFLVQVDEADLVDDLTISAYRAGQENVETFHLAKDAILVDEDGQLTRLAPRSSWVESAPAIKRVAINLAGPLMNFVLALLAAFALAFSLSQVSLNEPVLGQVAKSQPAAKAGLQSGDRIEKVNGQRVEHFTDFAALVSEQKDKEMSLTYVRNGKEAETQVQAEKTTVSGQTVYRIGVMAKGETGFLNRLKYGGMMCASWFHQVFDGIVNLFSTTFSLNKLGGPVMLAKATSTATNQGFLTVLALLGMLSVNLGLINLLPIPPLDGGKVFLDLYESIFKKPFPKKVTGLLLTAGTVALIILMILVTANDLLHF
ncbi:RIP metalloprotease RseP [Fructobacillus sp. M1-13]|uniref:Zinc metalloprotease n=1 Tax=Fructobacillus papyriferae TaxID=2713171 RepID=A0ABS5QQ94_9LACO|nr:RIP metalloprotease RseP [Fructobacillus papyriferae]MBS9334576.1 RIP metalloprotease RseP [Fructobacillus papyriferae]MCD2158565.1 RIP metalloprotease RseP [Fructobacillus papyriferae]